MSMSDELEKRCAVAGLKLEDNVPEEEGGSFFRVITEPGAKWRLAFSGDEDEQVILNSKFEKCRPLSGYDAMWSRVEERIECELTCERPFIRDDGPFDSLCRRLGMGRDAAHRNDLEILVPTISGQPRVSLGWNSPELRVWRCSSPAAHYLSEDRPFPVLRIQDTRARTDAEARTILETYGVAALLEFERAGFAARLRNHYPWKLWIKTKGGKSKPVLEPLRSAPDFDPVSLYWQGRSAESLPARFIGFYQVLEYYFPRCSRKAFVKKLKESLSGLALDDAEKVALQCLENAANKRGSPLGGEKAQMVHTVETIVTEAELRDFIDGDEFLCEHYRKQDQGIVSERIPAESLGGDLRKLAAERLYAIRCRLVHAKEDGEPAVFLPLSGEAAELFCDVVLMRFLARRALDKMSMPLPR